ncbi:MAG: hypothetical protein JWO11_2051 [Nocardioides sp.]|nr:hypothetical protein [Nocardioides sp.]
MYVPVDGQGEVSRLPCLIFHPAVQEVNQLRGAQPRAAIRDSLLSAWPGRHTKRLQASIDLALSFRTWQSLVRTSGLASRAAADLMAQSIGCAGRGGDKVRS